MKKNVRNAIIAIVAVAAIVVICIILSHRKVEDFHNKYEGVNLEEDVAGAERTGTYTQYISSHEDAALPEQDIEVDLMIIPPTAMCRSRPTSKERTRCSLPTPVPPLPGR